MQYPERSYALMSLEELASEADMVSRELSKAYAELAEVKVQYNWLFLRGYKDSVATSVSGRERDGDMAAVSIREDELKLEGQIGALGTIRDLLTVLMTSYPEAVHLLS
jgi:hypothetical protein